MINISNAQKIDGWMWNFDLYWLANHAMQYRNIMEIGSFLGRSTMALADNTTGIVKACDIWEPNFYKNADTDLFRQYPNAEAVFDFNLQEHIKNQKVIKFKGDIHNNIYWTVGKYDMIFIDGNHEYEFVKKDIQLAKRIVTNGLICGHDFGNEWKDVEKAVREEFGDNFKITGSSIWWVDV